ncbi:hypothetical protein LINPERPRIM_LOCUS13535 [Linum perenne]
MVCGLIIYVKTMSFEKGNWPNSWEIRIPCFPAKFGTSIAAELDSGPVFKSALGRISNPFENGRISVVLRHLQRKAFNSFKAFRPENKELNSIGIIIPQGN